MDFFAQKYFDSLKVAAVEIDFAGFYGISTLLHSNNFFSFSSEKLLVWLLGYPNILGTILRAYGQISSYDIWELRFLN